ncbi:RodZ family helix-turn-helix domain-containing protein [Bordetella sp. BOR01]|uniref:helix-turn-helix domain-containing protein n=1 Tax=Bordetella sp. BOR01 TaxID=2854779 RepID=UPI001C46777D|nr:helix-turn-helix transcriptional regulator [Bordetella sp. BOR01]MBV7482393.1 helix-turn-helix domain-containing protein [Bordetella sp. BOR01]
MTQELDPAVTATESPVQAQAQASTVGQALQALRVARGWSLEEVSSRIKFSSRQIQALENEQWAKLPSGVSLRGLIRSYARLLDADASAIVASLEAQIAAAPASAPSHRVARTMAVPVHPHDDDRSSIPWGWLLVIVALLVVLAAYAVWQGWLPAGWLAWFSRVNP